MQCHVTPVPNRLRSMITRPRLMSETSQLEQRSRALSRFDQPPRLQHDTGVNRPWSNASLLFSSKVSESTKDPGFIFFVEEMALPRGVAIALILSAVLVCVQDGSASSIGQNNLLDADQQNMTTPTTSPVTASPLYPSKQDLLHVEASDEARKALLGWLAKGTARLIFIYFDLVVGNLTYHPGFCPRDGKSASDAQTPLAWVLTRGGPDGGPGALGSHSFAHTYLTLPVSYPRLYSLGILEGYYVINLRDDVYRMKVVVDNSTTFDEESCWNSLNKTEKVSVMFPAVESFVSDLEQGATSQNTTFWKVCYSDPTISRNDYPRSITSISFLLPDTPVYVCQTDVGLLQRLEQESLLKGFLVLFFVLSFGMIVLQYHAFSKALHLLWFWGAKKPSRFVQKGSKTFHKDGFFDKLRLPVHVTIGGLLSSETAFGQQAFFRLKLLLISVACCLLYIVWPSVLVQYMIVPTSSAAKLRISMSETFDVDLPCHSFVGGWDFQLYHDVFLLGGVFFFIGFLSFIRDSQAVSSRKAQLKSFSVVFGYGYAPLFFLAFLRNVKHLLQLPLPFKRPWVKIDEFGEPGRSATKLILFFSFILAQLLFWLPWLVVAEILIFFSVLLELHLIFPCSFVRTVSCLKTSMLFMFQVFTFRRRWHWAVEFISSLLCQSVHHSSSSNVSRSQLACDL